MIPKTIHYCWFGGKEIPENDKKCIESWKKFCPDYEIVEWNESNFDVSICEYTKEAYGAKKWAFVADYARFWILYNYGGIYFDTDVELIRAIDDILARGAFLGTEPGGGIAPGLGIACEKGLPIFKEIINFYSGQHFVLPDGSINDKTIVYYTTQIFKKHGWTGALELQNIENIWIYPPEVFCPIDYDTGKVVITEKTVSIHHYSASWHTWLDEVIYHIEKCSNHNSVEYRMRRMLSFPFRALNKLRNLGLKNTLTFIKKRCFRSIN